MKTDGSKIRLGQSQSLWSRDYFLIDNLAALAEDSSVAIPLEQGLFFNSEVSFPSLFSICCKIRFQLLLL